MLNDTFETEALETLAERIAQCATEADERMIEAARMIRAARSRIDEGEAGEITWSDWARQNIDLSESRLRELQRIAEAEDPKAELDRQRALNKTRQARHRERRRASPLRNGGAAAEVTAEPDDDRQRVIDWVRTASRDDVAAMLSFIQQRDPGVAVSSADEPVDAAAGSAEQTVPAFTADH